MCNEIVVMLWGACEWVILVFHVSWAKWRRAPEGAVSELSDSVQIERERDLFPLLLAYLCRYRLSLWNQLHREREREREKDRQRGEELYCERRRKSGRVICSLAAFLSFAVCELKGHQSKGYSGSGCCKRRKKTSLSLSLTLFLMEYRANKAGESNSSFSGVSISECRQVTTGTLVRVQWKCSERVIHYIELTGNFYHSAFNIQRHQKQQWQWQLLWLVWQQL